MSERDAAGELTCDAIRELAGAFVLGALDRAEDAAVRAHLAACDDAHEEISELGSVLPALAESVPIVEPPAGLKGRVMAAAAADLRSREASGANAGSIFAGASIVASPPVVPTARRTSAEAPTPAVAPTRIDQVVRPSRPRASGWLLRIAAVVAVVVLGGWNLLLQGQVNAARTYEQNVAAVLDAAAKPGSLAAILTADGGNGSGVAAISADGRITIAMQGLAPTQGESVYEAWLIGTDGVPAPLGSFKVSGTGTAYIQSKDLPPPAGSILAVTLEPRSNAQQPTLPIISKGVATAAG